jgi:hypothetical protein
MTPVPTPGWEFRNDLSLSVWLSQVDEPHFQGAGSNVWLRISGEAGIESLSGARALYDFTLGKGEPSTVTLDASPTLTSQVTLESVTGGFFSAIVDLGGASSCPRPSSLGPFGIRLRDPGATGSTWTWENDYGAADRPPRSGWYRTERVQLVDAADHIVFGWARATSP